MRGWGDILVVLLWDTLQIVLSSVRIASVSHVGLGYYNRCGIKFTVYTDMVIGKLFANYSLRVKVLGQIRNDVVHQFLDNLLVFVFDVGMDTCTSMTTNAYRLENAFLNSSGKCPN
jgi:hypothetical protein